MYSVTFSNTKDYSSTWFNRHDQNLTHFPGGFIHLNWMISFSVTTLWYGCWMLIFLQCSQVWVPPNFSAICLLYLSDQISLAIKMTPLVQAMTQKVPRDHCIAELSWLEKKEFLKKGCLVNHYILTDVLCHYHLFSTSLTAIWIVALSPPAGLQV